MGGGGSLLPAGAGHCPPAAGPILGAAGRHEPGAPVAAAGQAGRSPRAPGTDLWLVLGSAAPKIEPDPIIDSKERSHRNRAGLTTSFSLASCSRVEHVLRLYLGAPAHRPPDRGKTVRGADDPERGLRLPASHRLASEKATDVAWAIALSIRTIHPVCPCGRMTWEANR